MFSGQLHIGVRECSLKSRLLPIVDISGRGLGPGIVATGLMERDSKCSLRETDIHLHSERRGPHSVVPLEHSP